MLASLLFPYDDDVPGLIEGWLDELSHEGCIIRYLVEDQHYLEICNWLNHQKIDRPSQSKLPTSRESSRILANNPRRIKGSKDQRKGSKEGSKPTAGSDDPAASIPVPPDRFADFWQMWPASKRKVDKAKCHKAWQAKKLEAVADQIIAHVTVMKATEQWLTGYEPAPLTYINGQRWQDGLPEVGGGGIYADQELSVIREYNVMLESKDWPPAVESPYSPDRAKAIREFLTFGNKEGWLQKYFGYLGDNLKAKPGYGFDWVIRRDTYLRAREGNFSVFQEAA